MVTRGIRGAISVDENSEFAIKNAVNELLEEMLSQNEVKTDDISHAIFTLTSDINIAFPAKFARELFDWKYVPMMCYNELNVPNALPMCLRILVVVNTEKSQDEIKHIYLKNAKKLRPDIA